jgi:selenocysteine lyase/cysteine desulfurase
VAEKAHAAGAKILVDAAQLAPHRAIDMRPDDDPGHLDFVALSAHKMYAPYGCGALIGPTQFFAEGVPDMVGGGTVDIVTVDRVYWTSPPDRDEAGSPNVVGAIALAQAVLSLEEMGMDALAKHEADLTAHALRRLSEIDGVELYGLRDPERASERVGVIPLNLQGMDHYKLAAILSFEGGIGVRNGCFCAHPYLLRLLQVPGEDALVHQQEILAGERRGLPGMVRISFGCYNNSDEVDYLADVLTRVAAGKILGDYEQDPLSGAYWPGGYEPVHERYFSLQPGLSPQARGLPTPGCGR